MMIEERQPEHDLSKASESLPILTKFLISLGFQLEFENSVLWGRRTVVGESVVVGFHALRSGTTDSIRDARRILARAARTEPGAALHLIATAGTTIPTDESQTFIDTDVKVASEIGYLNGTLLSESLCKTIIEEAEQYVPTAKYVEQRLGPGGALAVPFLNDWMASTERGLLVVLAHAGHGKTCLANHLGRRLAQQHLINDEKPVPFVFPLQRHRNVQRFEELVLTNLQDRGIYGFTSAAFAHLINGSSPEFVGCFSGV